jgi:hypothetical protein
MPKKPAAAEGLPTESPLDRVRAASVKLFDIAQQLRNIDRDLEAAKLSLLAKDRLEEIDGASTVDPLGACRQIEDVLEALDRTEGQGKDVAKNAREAGKYAEHLRFAVASLYREILARGEAERARLRDKEASRQGQMFEVRPN